MAHDDHYTHYTDKSNIPLWVPLVVIALAALIVYSVFQLTFSDKAQRLTPELIAQDEAKCRTMKGDWNIIRKSSEPNMGKVVMTWCHLPLETKHFGVEE